MIRIITLSFAILCCTLRLFAQDPNMITGVVRDSVTGSALSFASIGLLSRSTGTVSNEHGEFTINITENRSTDTLVVHFLGYLSAKLPLAGISQELNILLSPKAVLLQDVIIRPRPPTYYIKQAVKHFSSNYATSPFETTSYYREKMQENSAFVSYKEAVLKTYYPSYQDTTRNQHQLYLFREAESIQEMEFMKGKRERIAIKNEKKKRKKDTNTNNGEDKSEDNNAVTAQFGGPENILSLDIVKDPEGFLDSTMFRKFEYEFGGASYNLGDELMIINFKSRGNVDHLKQSGSVYIDINTYAIHAINFQGDVKIPVLIRPVLLLMGIGINDPSVRAWSRYQKVNDVWYPEYYHWKFNTTMIKRYKFKKNERSAFEIEQVFKVNKLNTKNPSEINIEKRFNVKEPMVDQVFNDGVYKWENVNRIK